ncbi:hypothetical protein D3C86_2003840 [compost metagenome]
MFTAGDNILNPLSDLPGTQMDIADLVYDLIAKKGEHNLTPLVFSDGDRVVNIFELKAVK